MHEDAVRSCGGLARACRVVDRWRETYEVGFRVSAGTDDDRDVVEVMVCLANGAGGVLIVGVEDDGTVSAFSVIIS